MPKTWVRVKYNQLENKVAVIRILHDDKANTIKKECLNNAGEWIPVHNGEQYLWDEIKDILLVSTAYNPAYFTPLSNIALTNELIEDMIIGDKL